MIISSTEGGVDHKDLTMPTNLNKANPPTKTKTDPLDPVIGDQKRITLILAGRDVADLFKGVVGDVPRLKVKKVPAVPDEYLIIYSADVGHFAELNAFVDVSIRDCVRRMTFSPHTGSNEALLPLLAQDNPPPTTVQEGPAHPSHVGLVKRILDWRVSLTLPIVLVVITLAFNCGVLATWLILAYGECFFWVKAQARVIIAEADVKELAFVALLYALRAVVLIERARRAIIRRAFYTIKKVLDTVVETLSELRGG